MNKMNSRGEIESSCGRPSCRSTASLRSAPLSMITLLGSSTDLIVFSIFPLILNFGCCLDELFSANVVERGFEIDEYRVGELLVFRYEVNPPLHRIYLAGNRVGFPRF